MSENDKKGQYQASDAHLDSDEVDIAIQFGLDEGRVAHLVDCKGCQNTVQWQRLANLGQLWDEEHDWACRVFEAFARKCREHGKSMIYAVRTGGRFVYSRLSAFPFQMNQPLDIDGDR